MVKAYFDYVQSHVFGLSNTNKVKPLAIDGGFWLACGELLVKFSLKTGDMKEKLDSGRQAYVTCSTRFSDSMTDLVAVGYADGDIAVFFTGDSADAIDDEKYAIFSEHSTSVVCISFNKSGATMVSGSMDNSIILWDVVGRSLRHKFVGHSGPITSLHFIRYFQDSADYLLSTSKDGCLRVWDIDTRRCLEIVPSKKNEVLSSVSIQGLKFVRNELFMAFTNSEECVFYEMQAIAGDKDTPGRYVVERGRFTRTQFASVVDVEVSHGLVVVANEEKGIEVLKMRSKAEVSNKFKRKKKRVMDKSGEKEIEEVFENKDEYMNNVVNWFEVVKTFKTKAKVCSVKFVSKPQNKDGLSLAIFYNNNTFELRDLYLTEENAFLKEHAAFENLAHQTVVRSCSFSSDDSLLMSASSDCVKIWTSLNHFQNIRSVQISDTVSCIFLPYLRFACLASRSGNLSLLNADTGVLEHNIEKAHGDTIWSIDATVLDEELIVATCSSDGTVKFWSLAERVKSKTMCLEAIRTVQVGEALQWVKFSHSAKHYTVALMDNSMQVGLGY